MSAMEKEFEKAMDHPDTAFYETQASINRLSEVLPKIDEFTSACLELTERLRAMREFYQAYDQDVRVAHMDEVQNQEQKWGKEKQ